MTRIIQQAPSVEELRKTISSGMAAVCILEAKKSGNIDKETAERVIGEHFDHALDALREKLGNDPAKLAAAIQAEYPGVRADDAGLAWALMCEKRHQVRVVVEDDEALKESLLSTIASKASGGKTAPPERTVGKLVERWLATEQDRVRGGHVGLARANMNKVCLGHFRDWIGSDASVESIDEVKWLEWYNWLGKQVGEKTWAESHVDRIFSVSKRFVIFLYELRLIERPRNIDSRLLSFKVRPKKITTWTNEEIAQLINTMTGQSLLHIYLMLNCGFLGKDISDLRQEEVDWKAGVITRKRSKTSDEEDVPTVRYKLWPRTFELLKQYRSSDPEVVLLTTTGRRWIEERDDGTYHRSDKVQSNLKYWMERAGVKKPPKALRATASTRLGDHELYGLFAQYYLGHSPRTVADKHYVHPSDKNFFRALEWLRKALGL